MSDDKYVLLCEHCSKDIGITPEELSTAIMIPKPLTDEEILDTFDPHFDADIEDKELIKFARAIEKKHGIL